MTQLSKRFITYMLAAFMAAASILSGCAGAGGAADGAADATEGTTAETASVADYGEESVLFAEVSLSGGSGRASVESPCPVYEKDGVRYARIRWSSSNYDYMIVDGEKILPINSEGNSEFEVPLPDAKPDAEPDTKEEDFSIDVQADTTAMGEPHLIDYVLSFHMAGEDMTGEEMTEEGSGAGDSNAESSGEDRPGNSNAGNSSEDRPGNSGAGSLLSHPELEGIRYLSTDVNEYAKCFAVHRYEGGYVVISVDDGRNYLIAPESSADAAVNTAAGTPADAAVNTAAGTPANTPEVSMQGGLDEGEEVDEGDKGCILIEGHPRRIYLAATAVMSQFDAIGAVGDIALSSLEADDWYIRSAREAMERGEILYGGKYSAPDYEQMVAMDVDLAIESMMILHAPKVEEKITQLGIPVLIDRSSYEEDPLGRAEWVKVYGVLTGREEEARAAFDEQRRAVESVSADPEGEDVSVAIFSINSTRQIVTRKRGDYFARMVERAGGSYCAPESAEDGGETGSTETISMEAFYQAAASADVLIYNATIENAPASVEELCRQFPLLQQFKAVQDGRVWCTADSLYQNASSAGWIIRDLSEILREEAPAADGEIAFFYRLR